MDEKQEPAGQLQPLRAHLHPAWLLHLLGKRGTGPGDLAMDKLSLRLSPGTLSVQIEDTPHLGKV